MQTPQREPSPAEVPNAPKKPKRLDALRPSTHRLVTARNLMRAFLEAQDTAAARRFNLVKPEAGLLKEQTPEARALDELGLKSICCRRMMLTHQDILDDVL
ncbi:g7895 [Coccomyxa viridis]|uniref:G7895 protein n=1 Tax=Coccomyxa viridis TaxID=1274662 RepID=A0ABP1G5K4_9CHLO